MIWVIEVPVLRQESEWSWYEYRSACIKPVSEWSWYEYRSACIKPVSGHDMSIEVPVLSDHDMSIEVPV